MQSQVVSEDRKDDDYAAYTLLVVLLIALAPAWPYSRRWSYYPTGTLGAVLLVVVALVLLGRFHI